MKNNLETYLNELQKVGLVKEFNLFNSAECQIQQLTYNSKEVTNNTLFICKGASFKEDYLKEAINAGAIAYVSEVKYEDVLEIPYICVYSIRESMPHLANLFYDQPWQKLTLIGIGGTKGKSTSTYYMKSIIDDYMKAINKQESAVISSIDVYDGSERMESHITTPESVELQRHLYNAVEHSIDYATMEVSSQALKYNRVDGMEFDIGIFLNISEDHISPIEHIDFEDYFSSKMKMFAKSKKAIVNLDSEYQERVLKEAKAAKEIITFSMKDSNADYYAYDIKKVDNEMHFKVKCKDFDESFVLTMPGLFNIENALSVIAGAHELKIPNEFIFSGLKRARSKGRMELYESQDKKVVAIVDYAHNKLSFEKLFSSMKEEYPDYSIISIFGCPGKKALTRRRDLGTIASAYADMIYLVAEDPGYEPVIEISREIAKYIQEGCPYEMIEERGEAIHKAISKAQGKTLLLITGKGAETRQKYNDQYIDCISDVEYAQMYLKEYDEKQ